MGEETTETAGSGQAPLTEYTDPCVVAFLGDAGGVGKTTLLIWLAWRLLAAKKKTVAVDLDLLNGGLTRSPLSVPPPQGDPLTAEDVLTRVPSFRSDTTLNQRSYGLEFGNQGRIPVIAASRWVTSRKELASHLDASSDRRAEYAHRRGEVLRFREQAQGVTRRLMGQIGEGLPPSLGSAIRWLLELKLDGAEDAVQFVLLDAGQWPLAGPLECLLTAAGRRDAENQLGARVLVVYVTNDADFYTLYGRLYKHVESPAGPRAPGVLVVLNKASGENQIDDLSVRLGGLPETMPFTVHLASRPYAQDKPIASYIADQVPGRGYTSKDVSDLVDRVQSAAVFLAEAFAKLLGLSA